MTPVWMNLYAPNAPATHVAAQDASGWSLDASGNIFQYDPVNYVWVQVAPPTHTSKLVSISASHDGTVLGVCEDGSTFLHSLGSWSQEFVSAHAVSAGAVGDINNFVVIDSVPSITRVSSTITSTLAAGPVKLTATASLGQIWGVGSTGLVYKYNSSTGNWDTVAGKSLAQIHVSMSGSTLQVVGVDSMGKGWSYNSSTATWTSIIVPNTGDKFTSIEAGNGYLWGLLTNGAVYRGYI